MKIAVARYPIDAPGSFAAFADKQRGWLYQAAADGAALAVLPEYLALELAAGFDAKTRGDTVASFAALQRLRADWLATFARLARETRMYVQAGTFLHAVGGGRYRNRADLFAPDGGYSWQDKLQLTGFEKKTAAIEGGDALRVFQVGAMRVGIAVCYDSEFPLPVRAQVEAGAQLILVPSCTDTAAGATRVRVGCLARALENRCFVAQSVTTGQAPWSPVLDINTGEAAVYAPMDVGFPDDGVLAATRAPGWAYAEIDPAQLEATRESAQVANDRDWRGQLVPGLAAARLQALHAPLASGPAKADTGD